MDKTAVTPLVHKARKRFGQNFLHDPSIISRIVHAIGPANNDHLVEIGPGQGALTNPLSEQLSASATLDLIELDRDLAKRLVQQFQSQPQINVHQTDALNFDFLALSRQSQRPLRIFGNLPYNISTPLIFHLLDQASIATGDQTQPVIKDMHFMLQKEVVERMSAEPGSKVYGRLSVMTQYYCQVEPLFEVPPEAFSPQPKVMSAIVQLTPYTELPFVARDTDMLAKVVRAAFSQRRKTLRNGLKQLTNADILESLDVNLSARAETLSIESFVSIANALS